MRTTAHSWCSTTQTAPGVVVMSIGFEHEVDGSRPQTLVGQTGIVCTTLFVAGSMRVTVPAPMLDVQTAPSPVATGAKKLSGAVGRSCISAVTVLVDASIRKISGPVRTQNEPKPVAPPTGV